MTIQILIGDVRERLKDIPADSVNCIVSSPPYFGLRDYGTPGQIGLEATPDEYVSELVAVLREARRTLKDNGTLWLNIGDSYSNVGKWGGATSGKHAKALHGKPQSTGQIKRDWKGTGIKPKDLLGIPWLVAFALRADGWYLRSAIVWDKPNAMPEPVKDRPNNAHEYVFLFSKSPDYYYDHNAAKVDAADGGKRNLRSVWSINTKPYKGAHFAVMPLELAQRCVSIGCPVGGTVLDPFGGSGTTGLVAHQTGRKAVLVELNPEYAGLAKTRIFGDMPLLEAAE